MANPLELTIDTSELERLAKLGDVARKIVNQNSLIAMQDSVDVVVGEVAVRTPVNTGALRQSIAGHVDQRPDEVTGTISSPLPYAPVMELGRRAGARQPPTGPLELWAQRQLGLSGVDAESAAFVIARSIGRKGIKPRLMFEKGLKEATPTVLRIWRKMISKTASQIERKV